VSTLGKAPVQKTNCAGLFYLQKKAGQGTFVWVLQSGQQDSWPAADLLDGGCGNSDVAAHEGFWSIPDRQCVFRAAALHEGVSGSSSQSTDETTSVDAREACALPQALLSFTTLATSVGSPSIMCDGTWTRELGVGAASALEN
jgi:hypothetical protein